MALSPHPVNVFVDVYIFVLFFIRPCRNKYGIVAAKHDSLVFVILLQEVHPKGFLSCMLRHPLFIRASEIRVLLDQSLSLLFCDIDARTRGFDSVFRDEQNRLILNAT